MIIDSAASLARPNKALSKLLVINLVMLIFVPVVTISSHGLDLSVASRPLSWAKTYGGFGLDVFRSVRQTTDGGFVLSGETGSFSFDTTWVVKLDPYGNVAWEDTIGGGGCEGSYSVLQTSDGGFVVSGESGSFPTFHTCITKLDAMGNPVWQKAYTGADVDDAFSMEATSDGGFIVVGETSSVSTNHPPDAFALRVDSNGNVVWQKSYGGPGWDSFGGVQQTRDGGFIAAGATESFGVGGFDGWLMELDAVGNTMWQMTVGGLGRDALGPVIQTADGGFVGAGDSTSFGTGSYDFDIWVVKVDTFGSPVWQKAYNVGIELGLSMVPTSDDGMILGGLVNSDAALLKLDEVGNVQWLKTYGGSGDDFFSAVQQTNDGGFIAAGHTRSFGVPGEESSGDGWVLKLDQRGGIIGQCHQKGRLNTSVVDTNSTSTITQAVTNDVSTIVTETVPVLTPVIAEVGVQCLPNGRRH